MLSIYYDTFKADSSYLVPKVTASLKSVPVIKLKLLLLLSELEGIGYINEVTRLTLESDRSRHTFTSKLATNMIKISKMMQHKPPKQEVDYLFPLSVREAVY